MSSCRPNGPGQPRTLAHRHTTDCEHPSTCRGCQPCTQPHCRVCGYRHTETVCGDCMDETREALHDIARMCGVLPIEVRHRGAMGEAMFLLGPTADPEARGHLEASVAVGRVPASYLAEAAGDHHPVWVLGTWDMVWRDALDHDTRDLVQLGDAVAYLDQTMTYMAGYPHLGFEEFVSDLLACRTHLEGVLRDGEQHDRGAPCMSCGELLERVWGVGHTTDGWKCPRCHRTSTEAQYRFAVAHLHREEATHLTARDCEIRTGVRAGTVRVWASRGLVARRTDAGRTLFAVDDVLREAATRRQLDLGARPA